MQSAVSAFHPPPPFSHSKSFFLSPNSIAPSNGPSLRSLPAQQSSRKLLCAPPAGKYIREDYLVLAVEYENDLMIVKVDTDDEYEFARDMQVRGLPTLYFISPDPNKDAIRTEGLIPIQMMRDIIDLDM